MTAPDAADGSGTGLHRTATGFDAAADAYRRARPGYPERTVTRLRDRLGLAPDRRVLDLGAGTGALTASLLATGAQVVAAEPVAGMRGQLVAAHPGAIVVAARAEAIPLRDGCLDAATVAQAFHWFDADRALAELRRVLRPEAWLAVLFNVRDDEDPVQAELHDLLRPVQGDTPSWASRDWDASLREASGFSSPEETVEHHRHVLDREGFATRVASISFVARLDDAPRRELLDRARALFDRHARSGEVAMGYRAELSLLRRLP